MLEVRRVLDATPLDSHEEYQTLQISNAAPYTYDNWYQTLHDTSINSQVYGWDDDNDPLTYHQVSGTSNGTLDFSPNGQFIYTPNAQHIGPDSFTFYVSDGMANSSIATIHINVHSNATIVYDDGYQMLQDAVLNTQSPGILQNDWSPYGYPLESHLISGPANASTFQLNADGSFVYQPLSGWAGTDSFTYRAFDGFDFSDNIATVTITVQGPTVESMTLGNRDPNADEPHLIYAEPTDNTGSVQIDIPGNFPGANARIQLGGPAI